MYVGRNLITLEREGCPEGCSKGTISLYVMYGCWKKRSTLIATPHINSSRTKLLFMTSMYSTMSLLNTYGATLAISNTTSSLSKIGLESCFLRTSVVNVGNFSAEPNLNFKNVSIRDEASPGPRILPSDINSLYALNGESTSSISKGHCRSFRFGWRQWHESTPTASSSALLVERGSLIW